MKKISIIFPLLLISLLLQAQVSATFYYKLVKQCENGITSVSVSGGQFITFYPGICFDTDKNGITVGNGTLKKTFEHGPNRTYQGQSYWGSNSTYYFTDNLSSLRVVSSKGDEYYYSRTTAPSNVSTSSLLSANKPHESSSSSSTSIFVNEYTPKSSAQSDMDRPHKYRPCPLCHTTGLKVKEIYLGSGLPRKWCSICNKKVSAGHTHVKCDLCGGTGYLSD